MPRRGSSEHRPEHERRHHRERDRDDHQVGAALRLCPEWVQTHASTVAVARRRSRTTTVMRMGSTRIFSFDGGGVRGVIPTVLLQRLTREPGLEDLLARVEFVAGTSTGGLIALMLAADLDLQAIRELYEQRPSTSSPTACSTTSEISARSSVPTTTSPTWNARPTPCSGIAPSASSTSACSSRRSTSTTRTRGPNLEAKDLPQLRRTRQRRRTAGLQGRHLHERGTDVLRHRRRLHRRRGLRAQPRDVRARRRARTRANLPADHAELSDVRLFSFGTGRSSPISKASRSTGATCSGSARSSTSCSKA